MSNTAHITPDPARMVGESEATMAPTTSPTLVAAQATADAMAAAVRHYHATGAQAPEAVFEAYVAAERTVLAERGRLFAGRVWTADGGPMAPTAWHHGPEAEAVAFERFDADGVRVSHGFIDAESRRIVQVG